MIKEDYVSFEVAKLLKEKGFNEPCFYYYKDKNLMFSPFLKGRNSYQTDTYSAPTHQMAMSWLREVHNIFIEPMAGETNDKTWYDFDIIPINGRKIAWNLYNNPPFVECNSYEESVEAALKYALENLI